jgi:hypothetical protein
VGFVAGAVLVPPRAPPDGSLPASLPLLLTPFEVSLSDEPEVDDWLPEPEPLPRLLESFEELRVPEEELDDPELATFTPRALAVFSSMRPVACRLLDF